MRIKSLFCLLGVLAVSVTAVVGQAKYSGIYSGTAQGFKFLLALTQGGRGLGLDSESEGLGDALNPAKTTVSAKGKIKGSTPKGVSFNAAVSGEKITGTLKSGSTTLRVSGKRIYK